MARWDSNVPVDAMGTGWGGEKATKFCVLLPPETFQFQTDVV